MNSDRYLSRHRRNLVSPRNRFSYGPACEALEDRVVPTFLPPAYYTPGTSPLSEIPAISTPLISADPSYFERGSLPLAGDFNGDGKADIATTGDAYSCVWNFPNGGACPPYGWASVLLNKGDGTFEPAKVTPLPDSPVFGVPPAVGDVNRDGTDDLVLFTGSSYSIDVLGYSTYRLNVLLGSVTGTFQPPVTLPALFYPGRVVVSDFNNDGNPDVVVGGASLLANQGQIAVYLGIGASAVLPGTTVPLLAPPILTPVVEGTIRYSLAVSDFNRDGNADLAAVAVHIHSVLYIEEFSVLEFLGKGDGTFQSPRKIGISPYGSLVPADLNGDDKADLVAGSQIALGNGDGSFQPPYSLRGNPYLSLAADFNGDGRLDLAGGVHRYDSTAAVLLGNGDGTFRGPVGYDVGYWGHMLATANFNGDGLPDLVGQGVDPSTPECCIAVLINDGDWQPALAVDDVSVSEGNSGTKNAIFTVTLAETVSETLIVWYSTVDGSATADIDYRPVFDRLTFSPGQTSKTVTVPVIGDTKYEANETFFLDLRNADATIVAGQGMGTITNDDNSPGIRISDVTKAEGANGTTDFVFTVTLSEASHETITVNYATADGTAKTGEDYNAKSGTLTFIPGETARTITIQVIGDTLKEASESFFLNLSGATNASILDAQALATISNDD